MASETQENRSTTLTAACDESNMGRATAFDTWGQLVGGLYLMISGVRRRSFTGGVMASIGSCLAYRGVVCLLEASPARSTAKADCPDPAVVDNPVDEASWESFPASDSPVFSGITK